MKTLAELHRSVQAGLQLRERDPLSYWRFAVEDVKPAVALFSAREPIEELHMRAPNKGAKTESAGAFVLACAQKRTHLDGVPLPQWRGPVTAKVLSLDYNEQKAGAQQTILRLIGKWPHKPRWKGDDILSTVRVMPQGGSDDMSTWSIISFHSQENSRAGVGRSDIVWADEPPKRDVWQEARKAAHAGRRCVRIISETPTFRRHWFWLPEEYGDPPRSKLTRINQDWAEVRWSLTDSLGASINQALSRREVEALLRQYWGSPDRQTPVDPLYDARVHGDYIDVSGLCPFNVVALRQMLDECVQPDTRKWEITREVFGENGLVRKLVTVDVDVLADPKLGHDYYMNIDPSKGINDPRHDPGGILGCEAATLEDVVMYEGYIGTYGLGHLASGLGRQYNNATVDPESNSGWSEGVLRGLADAGYAKISKTRKLLQPGKYETKLGFETTNVTRPAMIAAVQEWIDAYAAGIRYAPCRFRRVIQTLLDVVLDAEGKPVAAAGFNDEFLILKGQQLRQLYRPRVDMNLARQIEPRKSRDLTIEDLLRGEDKPSRSGRLPFSAPMPKRRPS